MVPEEICPGNYVSGNTRIGYSVGYISGIYPVPDGDFSGTRVYSGTGYRVHQYT